MTETTSKRVTIICFIVLFLNAIILSAILGIDNYTFDSAWYWTAADKVYQGGGKFEFSYFPETFRGCLLPLILLIVKHLIKSHWAWNILSAMMVACLFGVFLPEIIKIRTNTLKRCICAVVGELIFFYFWGNFLQYPLSDLPAAFFMAGGIFFVNRIISLSHDGNDKRVPRLVRLSVAGLCAGSCLYAAYNCRAAYLYGAVVIIVYFCFCMLKQRSLKNVIAAIVGLMVGIIVFSSPQCVVNMHYVGKYSPKVYTENYTNYGTDLQTVQVLWGLQYPRYETYLGDLDTYSSYSVWFDDPIGNKIISKEQLNDSFLLSDVFKLFVKYPLDMIGIYTRHLVSLITPAWNQLYIDNIYTNKFFVVMISIAIWYLAGLDIIAKADSGKFTSENMLKEFAFCLPAFLQLFGAPELRFFLPVYLILYSYITMKVDFIAIKAYLKKKWLVTLIISVIVFILWITVFGDTLSFNREQTFLINDISIG